MTNGPRKLQKVIAVELDLKEKTLWVTVLWVDLNPSQRRKGITATEKCRTGKVKPGS